MISLAKADGPGAGDGSPTPNGPKVADAKQSNLAKIAESDDERAPLVTAKVK